MNEDEDIYMVVVESIRFMALIHLLWWNTSFWNTRMNDAIMIIIMWYCECDDFHVHRFIKCMKEWEAAKDQGSS